MRSIFFISLLTICISCSITNVSAQTNELNGTWIPVSQEMGGRPFPKELFENQKLIISDSNYTVFAESADKGVVKYNGDKMDIYSKEGANAGKHFTAIYKYDNGELTICYNLVGDSYPETFDTKDKSLFFMSVFKKEIAK